MKNPKKNNKYTVLLFYSIFDAVMMLLIIIINGVIVAAAAVVDTVLLRLGNAGRIKLLGSGHAAIRRACESRSALPGLAPN